MAHQQMNGDPFLLLDEGKNPPSRWPGYRPPNSQLRNSLIGIEPRLLRSIAQLLQHFPFSLSGVAFSLWRQCLIYNNNSDCYMLGFLYRPNPRLRPPGPIQRKAWGIEGSLQWLKPQLMQPLLPAPSLLAHGNSNKTKQQNPEVVEGNETKNNSNNRGVLLRNCSDGKALEFLVDLVAYNQLDTMHALLQAFDINEFVAASDSVLDPMTIRRSMLDLILSSSSPSWKAPHLCLFIEAHDAACFRLLVERGAPLNAVVRIARLGAVGYTYHYTTPLIEATLRGSLDLVKLLLDCGADVNYSSSRLKPFPCNLRADILNFLLVERKIDPRCCLLALLPDKAGKSVQ